MGVFDRLFKKKRGKFGKKDQPKTIQEFVVKAVIGPSNCQINISDFADLNFALIDGLKNRGMKQSKIVSILISNSKLVGICPECGTNYTSEWLSHIATLKESGLVSKTIGLSSASVRFLEGKCRNPDCNCEEILILWRPDAWAPIDIFTEALKDKVVEVRKATARALREMPPDASGYYDANFVKVFVPVLTDMALKDEDEGVREVAKEALDGIEAKTKKS
jgi:hypothetical protein